MDEKWFKERMAEKGVSQRKLAEMCGKDAAQINRILSGKTAINNTRDNKTCKAFAEALGVPLFEVYRRAGIIDASVAPATKAKVLGYVEPDSTVVDDNAGLEIEAPVEMSEDTRALICRFADSTLDMHEGWRFFYERCAVVLADALGRLSVIEKDGGKIVGFLRRGYVSGSYNIKALDNSVSENQQIVSASPILWIHS